MDGGCGALRVHLKSVRLDGDCVGDRTSFEREIDAEFVADIQNQAGANDFLETFEFRGNRITPDRQLRRDELPTVVSCERANNDILIGVGNCHGGAGDLNTLRSALLVAPSLGIMPAHSLRAAAARSQGHLTVSRFE